jgi:hypothetical protein
MKTTTPKGEELIERLEIEALRCDADSRFEIYRLSDILREAAEALRRALSPVGDGGKGASPAESVSEGLRAFASESPCQSEGGEG